MRRTLILSLVTGAAIFVLLRIWLRAAREPSSTGQRVAGDSARTDKSTHPVRPGAEPSSDSSVGAATEELVLPVLRHAASGRDVAGDEDVNDNVHLVSNHDATEELPGPAPAEIPIGTDLTRATSLGVDSARSRRRFSSGPGGGDTVPEVGWATHDRRLTAEETAEWERHDDKLLYNVVTYLREELEQMDRKPLFEIASRRGIPVSRTVVMSREDLIDAIAESQPGASA